MKNAEITTAALAGRATPENAPQATAKRGEGHAAQPHGPQIATELHAAYCRHSKMDVRLRDDWSRLWWDLYVDRGSNLAELLVEIRIVCAYLRSQIARDKRNPGALRLLNLIQPDQFEQDLAEAKMMGGKSARAAAKSPALTTAPPGWRAWFEDQYPTKAPEFHDRPFTDLPDYIQRECREASND